MKENEYQIEKINGKIDSYEVLSDLLFKMDSEFLPTAQLGFNLDKYIKKILEFGEVFVCIKEEKTVGLLAVYANDLIEKKAFITSIGVLPQYRGNRLGKKLLDHACSCARERGMISISLEVAKSNKIALDFYFKNGFIYSKDKIHDSVILEKVL